MTHKTKQTENSLSNEDIWRNQPKYKDVLNLQDEFVGVIEKLVLSPEEACGLVVGESCGKSYNPEDMWNITLPNVPKPPVKPYVLPQVTCFRPKRYVEHHSPNVQASSETTRSPKSFKISQETTHTPNGDFVKTVYFMVHHSPKYHRTLMKSHVLRQVKYFRCF